MEITRTVFKNIFKKILQDDFELSLSSNDIENVCNCFFYTILELIKNGHSIRFFNFGKFYSCEYMYSKDKNKTKTKLRFIQSKNLSLNDDYLGCEQIYYIIYLHTQKDYFYKRTFYSIENVKKFLIKNFDIEYGLKTEFKLKEMKPNEIYKTDLFEVKVCLK